VHRDVCVSWNYLRARSLLSLALWLRGQQGALLHPQSIPEGRFQLGARERIGGLLAAAKRDNATTTLRPPVPSGPQASRECGNSIIASICTAEVARWRAAVTSRCEPVATVRRKSWMLHGTSGDEVAPVEGERSSGPRVPGTLRGRNSTAQACGPVTPGACPGPGRRAIGESREAPPCSPALPPVPCTPGPPPPDARQARMKGAGAFSRGRGYWHRGYQKPLHVLPWRFPGRDAGKRHPSANAASTHPSGADFSQYINKLMSTCRR